MELPAGTAVHLEAAVRLRSEEARPGLHLSLQVAEDVVIDGRIVVPRGSRAVGKISGVAAGAFGSPKTIKAQAILLDVNGYQVALRGDPSDLGRIRAFVAEDTSLGSSSPTTQRPLIVGGGYHEPAPSGRSARSTGTGFFVSADGEILTSHHVVEGASLIHVTTAEGRKLTATLSRASPATDLAVLKVDFRPRHYLGISAGKRASTGDRVFTLGFPVSFMLGREPKFTEGSVSALSGLQDEQSRLQISVPVQPGNSGGPLVNEKGEVLGIIASQAASIPFYQSTGTLPQNINWAVKSDYAVPLLTSSTPSSVAKDRQQAVALTKNAVVFIEAQE